MPLIKPVIRPLPEPLSDDQIMAKLLLYQERPDLWAEEVLGIRLEPYQREILIALARYKKVAVHTGHGVGKSFVSAVAVLWFMFVFPRPKAVTTAPTDRQVTDAIWGQIHYLAARMDFARAFWDGPFMLGKTRLELSEDVFATGEASAQSPVNLEGYHAPYMLYVVDEAKAVPDAVFESIDGAMTSGAEQGGASYMLVISTPGQSVGRFYRICTRLEQGWYVVHVDAEKSRRVSADYIRDMQERHGRDSAVYRMRVRGLFDDRGSDAIIPLAQIEACCEPTARQTPEGLPEIGVDVARGGEDRTVIVVRQGVCVLSLTSRIKRDTQWTVDVVAGATEKLADAQRLSRRQIRIKVDDVGVGGGVTDGLKRRGFRVIPVGAGNRPRNTERYRSRRDELWFGMAERVKEGRLDLTRLPRGIREEVCSELSAPRFTIDMQDRFIAEPKKDTKKRIKKSPDLADGVILAFASGNPIGHLGGTGLRVFKPGYAKTA